MTTALICEQCGAPMENRRKCGHCRTVYYTGPDVDEAVDMKHPYIMDSYSSISTCMMFSTNNGYYEPNGQYVSVERMYGQ